MDTYEMGERLREERKRRGMTQKQLAQRAHVSRTTVWQVETGKYDDLGIRKLIRIADALGLCFEIVPVSAPPALDELLLVRIDVAHAEGHLPGA